jgi:competence protein ComEC
MVPGNAVLVPLVGVLTLPLALLGAGLVLVWPGAGLALWHLALIPANAAVDLAQALAALPGAVHYLAGPGPAAVAAIYAAALALLIAPRPWRRPAAAGLALLAAALWLAGGRPPAPDGTLTAWVLDVGQGSSTVVRLPRGQVVVVDGGGWPGSDFDFGQRVVGPFLWSLGFSRLSVVAASHRHPDHAGGIPFLVRWFSPGQVWVNQTRRPRGLLARIVDLARTQGVPVRGPADLPREMNLGGARVRLVWPPRKELPRRWRENQRGLWLGFGLGRAWLWLPADNGPRVERRVAPTLPTAGFHLLVAPHHGGKGSCTRRLLDRLRPQIVVFSCACAGRYPMPRPEVLARVQAAGATTFSTARWGCLRLSTRGGPWRVQPYLSRPRACP